MPIADSMIQVRKARPEDAGQIVEVHTGTWRHSFRGYVSNALLDSMVVNEAGIQWWREVISDANPNRCVLVTVKEEKIIAFVSGGTDMDRMRGYDSEIKAIYVQPEAQRSGVGKLLMRAFSEFVISRNARSMIIWTIAEGPTAGFYLALGGELLPIRDYLERGAEKIATAAYAWRDLAKLRKSLDE